MCAMSQPSLRIEQVQAEILEIAEILQREQGGRTITDVWEEALSLHRVRYEREVRSAAQPR